MNKKNVGSKRKFRNEKKRRIEKITSRKDKRERFDFKRVMGSFAMFLLFSIFYFACASMSDALITTEFRNNSLILISFMAVVCIVFGGVSLYKRQNQFYFLYDSVIFSFSAILCLGGSFSIYYFGFGNTSILFLVLIVAFYIICMVLSILFVRLRYMKNEKPMGNKKLATGFIAACSSFGVALGRLLASTVKGDNTLVVMMATMLLLGYLLEFSGVVVFTKLFLDKYKSESSE